MRRAVLMVAVLWALLSSGAPASASALASAVVRTASLKVGDPFVAGPVLLHGTAVWAEAGGSRLLARALTSGGRTRTVFSTRATPGVPRGSGGKIYARSLATGEGRLAFVDGVQLCGFFRGHCVDHSHGGRPPFVSYTLVAGRPGSLRRLQQTVGFCPRRREPHAVAVTDVGLVVDEEPAPNCTRQSGRGRLVLMSFAGRVLRVLRIGPRVDLQLHGDVPVSFYSLVGAGHFVAFSETTQRSRGLLIVIDVRTGRVVERLPIASGAIAIDPAGMFALSTFVGYAGCEGGLIALQRVSIGQVGSRKLTVVAPNAAYGAVAVAAGGVALATIATGCDVQANLTTTRGPLTPVPGLQPKGAIAFDGRSLAAYAGPGIQLTRRP